MNSRFEDLRAYIDNRYNDLRLYVDSRFDSVENRLSKLEKSVEILSSEMVDLKKSVIEFLVERLSTK